MFSPTESTQGDVTLTGKATDLGSGISYYQFSTNGNLTSSSSGWISITNTTAEITQTYSVSANGTYYFYVKDAAGNITKKSVVINKIDKILPKEFNFYPTEVSGADFKAIVGNTTDDDSGIDYYQYSKDGGNTWQNSNEFLGLSPETNYVLQMRAIDKAGNIRYSPSRETSTSSSSIRIRNISSEGYFDILVFGRGYSNVSCAVWSEYRGQDDLIWHQCYKINENNEWTANVNVIKDHAHSDTGGFYNIEAYATGGILLEHAKVWIPGTKYIDGNNGNP